MTGNTIFKHLFTRMAVIMLGISLIFSIALIPIYQNKLLRMLAAQGNTFANTTIAACREALYTKDFSFIITYVNKVLRQTPEITFVTLVSKEGLRLNIDADKWHVDHLDNAGESVPYTEGSEYRIIHSRELPERRLGSSFLFTKAVNISGFQWGEIELGISDAEYTSLMSSYFRNVLLSSVILVAISLLILRGVSSKLAQQLAQLRRTALALSKGNLTARAPTEAIGEIQLLATTLNGMAESLDINTRSVRQLARLVEDTHDAIAIFGDDKRTSFVNPALMDITGHSLDFYTGMSLHALFEHLGIDRSKQLEISTSMSSMEQLDWSTDVTLSALSGELMHMTLRIEAFDSEDLQSNGFFIVLSDITRRKQLEFELESLAYIDKLTKLPNRRYFTDQLSEAVKEAEVFGSRLAVFFLDLDNFKIINDSLGHEVGDLVLSEAAWRIQDTLRSDDIVCRLGGDEFTVIIKGAQKTEELAKLANSMIQAFVEPIIYKERELRIGTSIGIVQYPDDGQDEKELIKNADTAMYAAKHAGKNAFRFFTQDMHRDLHDYIELENALRKAIDNSDLQLVYQPIVDVETQKITNCEALLRWQHPERGYISPARFIPVAEQSGLIGAIGDWVFTEVCKQLKQWGFNINVSINVSGSELVDKGFINRLQDTLLKYDIEAYRIQLEFTEHVVVSKDGSNLSLLNALKRAGFRIAVDDFGTGFSSLSYLTELPVDVIKIDKSFISRLPHDRRTIAVVNAIISLAENLDLMTIGEGAEHKSQVDWLRTHGCNTIQGYYFHKPMPAVELERLMTQKSAFLPPVKRAIPYRVKEP
jgi:diguanylate cyclase (GGDEF)-like protein/PAS domain S-box-containing protein